MESGVAEKQQASSYTYWVRGVTEDAAPLPVPRKLSPEDISNHPQPGSLGSVWNRAGTWEEKNLNTWASNRIKLNCRSCYPLWAPWISLVAEQKYLKYQNAWAFLVTVRNKKRVGYTYELTLKFKGEWSIQEEWKKVKGHIDIPEFSFGELDDLQIEIRFSEDKDLVQKDKQRIGEDLKRFLQPIRKKLLQFEQELKDR